MHCTIQPGKIRGQADAPASKSYAQRAILIASQTAGKSRLMGMGFSDDVLHALHSAMNLGAEIRYFGNMLEISGGNPPRTAHFYAGESGLTARILGGILMTLSGNRTLTGSGSLVRRPFEALFPVYDSLGLKYSSSEGRLPLHLTGKMLETDLEIDGSLSSQFISGLLIALTKQGFSKNLTLHNTVSRDYIEMTLEALRAFGVDWISHDDQVYRLDPNSTLRPADFQIEGDWSGAAFLIAAGLTAGQVSIGGLNPNSLQADRAIMKLLSESFQPGPEGLLILERKLPAFDFDATDCPDLFPPLAVIAADAQGPCRIKGVHRLGHKESDRAKTLQEEFARLWVRIDLEGDYMIVHPSKPTGGIVQTHNDHRIAMALSILGLNASEPLRIEGVECVSKSYPSFYHDLKRLGVRVELE